MRRVMTLKRIPYCRNTGESLAGCSYFGAGSVSWQNENFKEGLFHGWFNASSEDTHGTDTVALVEFPDGSVEEFTCTLIRFLEPPKEA